MKLFQICLAVVALMMFSGCGSVRSWYGVDNESNYETDKVGHLAWDGPHQPPSGE
ncbi:MAG: hypothetical protein OER86_09590 [Phycisphaerae bacterium]|nr:hypothetical protein [Phycisphaerae bacterium]